MSSSDTPATSEVKSVADTEWQQIIQHFVALVIQSPPAVVTVVLSSCLGYGISFVLFDYRRNPVKKSHYLFHPIFGMAYAALIFFIINWDLVSQALTVDQIAGRMPFTLLVSFCVAFFIMFGGAIWRQRSSPYTG